MENRDDSKSVLFWRDGFDAGQSGHYVRGASLNTVISQWIADGIKVAAIRIHPDGEGNVDVLIVRDDA